MSSTSEGKLPYVEAESFLHSWFLEETMAYQPSREVLQILVDMNCRTPVKEKKKKKDATGRNI